MLKVFFWCCFFFCVRAARAKSEPLDIPPIFLYFHPQWIYKDSKTPNDFIIGPREVKITHKGLKSCDLKKKRQFWILKYISEMEKITENLFFVRYTELNQLYANLCF